MLRSLACCVSLMILSGGVVAEDAAPTAPASGDARPSAGETVTATGALHADATTARNGDSALKADAALNEAARKADAPGDAAAAKTQSSAAPSDAKVISGMSILGNQEAPKSLVIVPWKSSQIGDMTKFNRVLDDSTQPVDKEVFMRELAYYQIRETSK